MMNLAIQVFRDSLDRVEHLGGLHDAIKGITTSAIDASDLLRAQIVMAVSAFDFYIHELTLRGMIEVYSGNRAATDAFKKYNVSIGSVIDNYSRNDSIWFENEVRERHGVLSFQKPDKVADAIRLFSNKKLWESVAKNLDTTDKAIKDRLKLIIDRRNKIAHEADLDPSFPSARWPISPKDVKECIDFIRTLGEAINATVL